MRNDIAIVFVVGKFEFNNFVQPIMLPQQGAIVMPGSRVTVAGWGQAEGGKLPNILKYADISILADEVRQKVYDERYWAKGMLCSGPQQSPKRSCAADYGSPLTFNGTAVGLISWAKGCGSHTYPTAYTRVSSYVDWVKETISLK